jgi:hypothetical protein
MRCSRPNRSQPPSLPPSLPPSPPIASRASPLLACTPIIAYIAAGCEFGVGRGAFPRQNPRGSSGARWGREVAWKGGCCEPSMSTKALACAKSQHFYWTMKKPVLLSWGSADSFISTPNPSIEGFGTWVTASRLGGPKPLRCVYKCSLVSLVS